VADRQLPTNLDALYLGGGYPELYAGQLSGNGAMRRAIGEWIEADGVVYAECGGFMYLTDGIVDNEGAFHPMVGAFPVRARMQEKRASLGYREVRTTGRSCFGPTATVLRGHEFHYSNIEPMPAHIARIYELSNGSSEGYSHRRVLGGYMHLHFGFSPLVVREFINFCREANKNI
jgi:cobyrinic acid a,c-diamide synthase